MTSDSALADAYDLTKSKLEPTLYYQKDARHTRFRTCGSSG